PKRDTRPNLESKHLAFLVKFDGKYENFNNFWETFLDVVDGTNARDAIKLNKLRENLDENSKRLVHGLDNYQYVKQRLFRYYTNRHAVRDEIMKRLVSIPRVHYDSTIKDFHATVGMVQNAYSALDAAQTSDDFLEAEFYRK